MRGACHQPVAGTGEQIDVDAGALRVGSPRCRRTGRRRTTIVPAVSPDTIDTAVPLVSIEAMVHGQLVPEGSRGVVHDVYASVTATPSGALESRLACGAVVPSVDRRITLCPARQPTAAPDSEVQVSVAPRLSPLVRTAEKLVDPDRSE